MIKIRKNTIEIKEINHIIETKAYLIEKLEFKDETINFLEILNNEYSDLAKQIKNSIEDIPLYYRLLDIIEKECDEKFKLAEDIKCAIKHMENGEYSDFYMNEIENDMTYINWIINRKYNSSIIET